MPASRLAPHARGKVFKDEVFAAIAGVQEAVARVGREAVVDATIGALCDEAGRHMLLPTVGQVFRNLPDDGIAAYASSRGLPEYLEAAIRQTFGPHRPDAHIQAVATPGGTGAIHNWFHNYSQPGEAILTHDWHWQPYQALASDLGRTLETFPFLAGDGTFNFAGFEARVRELSARQRHLAIVLNTPNHNPTGYSLRDGEWDQVLDLLGRCATGDRHIALLVDVAYLDYLPDPVAGRAFMRKFGALQGQLMAGFAFSMSKGYTLYGQRAGALIGVSSDPEAVAEFAHAAVITARSRWSSVSRAAMTTLIEIHRDHALLAQVDRERAAATELIHERAALWSAEAEAAGLPFLPYCGGFFITVPTPDSARAGRNLADKNIFVVPLDKGLRIAVCAVPLARMRGLAAAVAGAL